MRQKGTRSSPPKKTRALDRATTTITTMTFFATVCIFFFLFFFFPSFFSFFFLLFSYIFSVRLSTGERGGSLENGILCIRYRGSARYLNMRDAGFIGGVFVDINLIPRVVFVDNDNF